jgi:hypothetical protein
MPHDRTIPTEIAATAKANLFLKLSPSEDPVGASSRRAPRASGRRIVRLDSSPATEFRLPARVSEWAHAADERARRLLRLLEARPLGPLALTATLLVAALTVSVLVVSPRSATSAQVAAEHRQAQTRTSLELALRDLVRLKAGVTAAITAREEALADAARWRSRALTDECHRTNRRRRHR